MKTAIAIIALVLHAAYLNAQLDGQYRAYNPTTGDAEWVSLPEEQINLQFPAGEIENKWYFNLQGGTTENHITDNATLTYQVGIRYQITDVGIKASFNQTDGINHTFDSYTLSGTYQPLECLYLSLGTRYDHPRGWGYSEINPNVGINGLIPLSELAKINISLDHTFSGITNIMVGIQLHLKLKKNGKQRFF